MVYSSFKKVRFFIVIISILCSFSANAQKKISKFSDDYSIYIDELNTLMSASDNSDLKDNFKQFRKLSLSEFVTQNQQKSIISLSNKMLDNRMRATPHFNQLLITL